jgi:pyridoxamine 5'-phosphate oxidase
MADFPFPDDPLEGFLAWFEAAKAAGERQPEAMALATCTPDGRPSARMVLYKGLSGRGLRFFTNFESRKGRELAENPRAATVFYWDTLDRQVRFEGPLERLSDEEADAYFHSRPRASQLNSATSPQSRPLDSYEALAQQVAALEAALDGATVPRPAHWGGFRLVPERVELWVGETHRLHQRALYVAAGGRWTRTLLAP